MASGRQHLLIGAALGAGLNALFQLARLKDHPGQSFDWLQFGASTAIGGAVGILADVIEPAINPNHRAFFHSVSFAGGIVYATHGPHTQDWKPEQRAVGRLVCYCYVSHLVADAITPRGLPLF